MGHLQRPGAGAEHLERDPRVPAAPRVPPGAPLPQAPSPTLLSQVHLVISINAGKTFIKCNILSGASLIAQLVKNLPAMQETLVRFLDWEDPLENSMDSIVHRVTKSRTGLSHLHFHFDFQYPFMIKSLGKVGI